MPAPGSFAACLIHLIPAETEAGCIKAWMVVKHGKNLARGFLKNLFEEFHLHWRQVPRIIWLPLLNRMKRVYLFPPTAAKHGSNKVQRLILSRVLFISAQSLLIQTIRSAYIVRHLLSLILTMVVILLQMRTMTEDGCIVICTHFGLIQITRINSM